MGLDAIMTEGSNFDAKAICCCVFPNRSVNPCNNWSRKGTYTVIHKYTSVLAQSTFARPVCFLHRRGVDGSTPYFSAKSTATFFIGSSEQVKPPPLDSGGLMPTAPGSATARVSLL